jgi:hypothetical protein
LLQTMQRPVHARYVRRRLLEHRQHPQRLQHLVAGRRGTREQRQAERLQMTQPEAIRAGRLGRAWQGRVSKAGNKNNIVRGAPVVGKQKPEPPEGANTLSSGGPCVQAGFRVASRTILRSDSTGDARASITPQREGTSA